MITLWILLSLLYLALFGVLTGLVYLMHYCNRVNDRVRALEGEPVFGSDFEAEEHNYNIRQDWWGPIGQPGPN